MGGFCQEGHLESKRCQANHVSHSLWRPLIGGGAEIQLLHQIKNLTDVARAGANPFNCSTRYIFPLKGFIGLCQHRELLQATETRLASFQQKRAPFLNFFYKPAAYKGPCGSKVQILNKYGPHELLPPSTFL